jgi:hypothetical protein
MERAFRLRAMSIVYGDACRRTGLVEFSRRKQAEHIVEVSAGTVGMSAKKPPQHSTVARGEEHG